MEHKFKVGDKVKIKRINFEIKGYLEEGDIGKTCTITETPDGDTYILDDNKYSANFPESSLELVKSDKPKIPTHLVVWELEGCGDPCKFFTSEPEAKDFVKELSEKSNTVKDSILLVEIKSCKKVTIRKSLHFVKHKI